MSSASDPDSTDDDAYPHPRQMVDLFGQADAEAAFLRAWAADRLHHAWLLRGPWGIGKATLAYRIARALIATPPKDDGGLFGGAPAVPETLAVPVGCPIAARIRAQSEPGLRVLTRTPSPTTGRLRNQIAVEDVRAVKAALALSSPDGHRRVIIVDAADEMTTAAANALLKILEEPPAQTTLLLISHAPGALLPTVRSRCRFVDLSPLGTEDLLAALDQAGHPVAPDETETLATLATGSVAAALRMAAGDGVALYGALVDTLGRGENVDRQAMIALADQAGARDATEKMDLLVDLIGILTARLARSAALPNYGPAPLPAEAALFQRVAASPRQAALWAEAFQRVGQAMRHARAVNLDPAQTIMDTFLDLDAVLAEARRAA